MLDKFLKEAEILLAQITIMSHCFTIILSSKKHHTGLRKAI